MKSKLFLKNKCSIALWRWLCPMPELSRYWKTTSPWQRAYCLPPMEINPESPVIIVISNAKVVYYKKSNWYFIFSWQILVYRRNNTRIPKNLSLRAFREWLWKEQIPGTFHQCISYKPLKQMLWMIWLTEMPHCRRNIDRTGDPARQFENGEEVSNGRYRIKIKK